jgi:AcrR family transcriptional regulator
MTPAADRRTALLDKLADHILAHGLSASSLRPLAKAAGTSDRMLLYYFPDKDALVAATIEVVAARLTAILETHATAGPLPYAALKPVLLDLILTDDLWPYLRLWLEIAARAAQGDALCRMVGEQIGRGFLAWGAAQLDSTDTAAREVEAAQLMVALEGALFLKSVGMEDVAVLAR